MLRKIYAIQESDLRMDGSLAMSVQRVLPVTQGRSVLCGKGC